MDFTSFPSLQDLKIKFSIRLVSAGLLRMRREKESRRKGQIVHCPRPPTLRQPPSILSCLTYLIRYFDEKHAYMATFRLFVNFRHYPLTYHHGE